LSKADYVRIGLAMIAYFVVGSGGCCALEIAQVQRYNLPVAFPAYF
jgi:hypothetical protein